MKKFPRAFIRIDFGTEVRLGGGGAKIIPLGEAVIAAFRGIENDATELVQIRLAKLLGQRVLREA